MTLTATVTRNKPNFFYIHRGSLCGEHSYTHENKFQSIFLNPSVLRNEYKSSKSTQYGGTRQVSNLRVTLNTLITVCILSQLVLCRLIVKQLFSISNRS